MPVTSLPLVILPTAIRPTYGEYSSEDISICGVPSTSAGAGISSRIASRSGVMLSVGFFQSVDIHPCLALPKIVRKSSWSSLALRENMRSKTSSWTSSGRQFGLSTLFTTTIGFLPMLSAFWSTNLVWGMQPSNASTRSRTPSAIFSTRSTSPPKSLWPGVSIILIFTPL